LFSNFDLFFGVLRIYFRFIWIGSCSLYMNRITWFFPNLFLGHRGHLLFY